MQSARMAVFAAVGLGIPSVASGQGTVDYDYHSGESWSQYLDYDANYFGLYQAQDNGGLGVDLNINVQSPFTGGGWKGLGEAIHQTAYSPSNPGINGSFSSLSFDAKSIATVTGSGGWYGEYAGGYCYMDLLFSVSATTSWSYNTLATGNSLLSNSGVSEAFVIVGVWDFANNTYISYQSPSSQSGVGDFNTILSDSGVIPPGQYAFQYRTWAQHGGNSGSPTTLGSADSSLNGIFTLVVPAPATGLLGAAGLMASRRRRP